MEAFGEHLRRWRRRRAFSQLELATRADTSSRHLSFLESGRSSPGRGLVLRLAEALDIESAERDRALEAAGLEPFRRSGVPAEAERALLARTLEALLAGHDPMPALALGTDWRLLGANAGGTRLLAALGVDLAGGTAAGEAGLAHLLIAHADSGLILDWEQVADGAVRRGRAELARRDRPSPVLAAALARLDELLEGRAEVGSDREHGAGGAQRTARGRADGARPAAVVPLRLRIDGRTLSLVTVLAQFGGVDYVELDAPRVELMLPADEPTRLWFERDG